MVGVLERLQSAGLRVLDPQESKAVRLLIFGLFVLTVGSLLVLARLYLLLPSNPQAVSVVLQSAQSVCDNLIASCLVVFAASIVLVFLSTSGADKEDIQVLQPWHIRPSLIDPLSSTSNYWFRGRSGRFFRAKVLPTLAEAAKRNASTRRVHLLLPDPNKTSLLDTYANYRNSLNVEKGEHWTVERIQAEIFATIFAVAEECSSNQFFEGDISLSEDFTMFRIDMSDERMVMTREDPQWPGITCSKHSKFYSSYREEIKLGMSIGKSVPINNFPMRTRVDGDNVERLSDVLRLSFPTESKIKGEVLRALRECHDPYA